MQTYTNNIVLTWVALTGTVLGGSPRVGEGSERRWGGQAQGQALQGSLGTAAGRRLHPPQLCTIGISHSSSLESIPPLPCQVIRYYSPPFVSSPQFPLQACPAKPLSP